MISGDFSDPEAVSGSSTKAQRADFLFLNKIFIRMRITGKQQIEKDR